MIFSVSLKQSGHQYLDDDNDGLPGSPYELIRFLANSCEGEN